MKIGKELGLLILKRAKRLSSSYASAEKVWCDALFKAEKMTNKKFDYSFYLEPTSPFRDIKQLKDGLKQIIKKKLDTVISVSKTSYPIKDIYSAKSKKKLLINDKKDLIIEMVSSICQKDRKYCQKTELFLEKSVL